jgi:tetratricopeptide (TPR) repeat protein
VAEADPLRRQPRRRSSPWLVIVGVLLAVIGVVAGAWSGPSWLLPALAVAAAGGGVLLEYQTRVAAEADDRRDRVDRSSGVLDQGRFPLVAALGLAEFRVHSTVVELGYIRRDREDRLRNLLEAGIPALVVGLSLAGKTRMAVQVVRDLYHDWPVWIPERPNGLSELLPVAVPEHVLVWLDDLEAFLTAEEPPRVGWLTELRRRGCRVVATIRASEYERFQPSGELRSPLEDVLGRFEVVWLEVDQAERDRMAGSAPDPRTAAGTRGHGVGEYVGGADLALERYRIGQATHPLGVALVRAAADWRRIGLDDIPEGVLEELAGAYLPTGLRVSPGEELAAALMWAGGDIGGRVRLLEQTEHGWRVFDYLLDHLDDIGDPVPETAWAAALRWVTEATALPVGYAAYAAGRLDDAATALRLAQGSPVPAAAAVAGFGLGVVLGQLGRAEEAVAVYTDLAARYGDDPAVREQVAMALYNKGVRLGQLDRAEEEVAV